MASLRTASAARLLRAASHTRPIAARRFETTLSATQARPPVNEPTLPESSHNQPDYEAQIDKATSTFTPVPKRVLNGSEEGPSLPAAVLSGAPMELQGRTVRIYKPAKPATQSGDWIGKRWRLDWDVLPKGHRWENPLMGWQSSGDFVQGTHIHFKTKEDAIAFAEKQGYEYFVQEPNERKFTPKAYANNFLYSPKKLKHIRTK
ncbi:putative nadh-ubiquinone oxidoreductase 18 kda protein [Phaeoacremonium minimum UCRPA7]|uniref:NADH dehydrogenase [ubiquinone] iron-sulfur protein 4, mitochondrial n=1 Tax=Phaeoacremonium minimum (strain UCR-PA7) TaxID=1286976 RepID=R8BWS1_PHAM7|nr:putative nadh-ubiquinone oxidoreductase 18 kda protein [Phaeoacremonium minimum UCRPA7]EOO03821.1 putative nadh-ubiquinone oxidoreductase 18 kda protein [Phaeoacremonium minimum UCRPA7]